MTEARAPAADRYVDGSYALCNPGWHDDDAAIKARWIAAFIEHNRAWIGAGPLAIADIGCGTGGVLAELHRLIPGTRCHGFDVSPHALALCQPKAGAQIGFTLGPLAACAEDAFDIAMAIDVVEHVDDYPGFLVALKRKGRFKLLHIPLDLTVYSVMRPRIIAAVRQQFGHLHYFTKDTAIAALEGAGYTIIDWRYTHHARELPGGGVKRAFWNAVRRVIGWVDEDLAIRLLGGASLLVLAR